MSRRVGPGGLQQLLPTSATWISPVMLSLLPLRAPEMTYGRLWVHQRFFFFQKDSHEHKPSSHLFPRQDRGCRTWQRLTFWHGYQEVEHLLRQVRPNGQDLLLKLGV